MATAKSDSTQKDNNNSSSTALIAYDHADRATAKFCNGKCLMLPFGKNTYYVPEKAVISQAKGTNRIDSIEVLNQIVWSKSPLTWRKYLDPDRLMKIRGKEGTSIYTTFKIVNLPDDCHPEEEFIRHVPPNVCAREFPLWKEKVAKEVKDGIRQAPKEDNPRHVQRMAVLDWTPEDCQRPQVQPDHNNWEIVKDPPKSCKKTPTTNAAAARTTITNAATPGRRKRNAIGAVVGSGSTGTSVRCHSDEMLEAVHVGVGNVENGHFRVETNETAHETSRYYAIKVHDIHFPPQIIDGELIFQCYQKKCNKKAKLTKSRDVSDFPSQEAEQEHDTEHHENNSARHTNEKRNVHEEEEDDDDNAKDGDETMGEGGGRDDDEEADEESS